MTSILPPLKPMQPLGKIPYRNDSDKKKGRIFKIAVYSTLSFFVLSLPISFRIVDQIYSTLSGNNIFDENGLVTMKGTGITTGVFFFIMCYLLYHYG